MKLPNKRILTSVVEQRKLIAFSCVLLLLQACLVAVSPIPLKLIVDHLTSGGTSNSFAHNFAFTDKLSSLEFFWLLVGGIGLFAILEIATIALEEIINEHAAVGLVSSVRKKLFKMLMTSRFSIVESSKKFELLATLDGDSGNMEVIVTSGLKVAMNAIPTILLVTVTMFWVDLYFALSLLLVTPLMYFIGAFFSKRMRKDLKTFRSQSAHYSEEIYQSLSSLQIIKSFALESTTIQSMFERIERLGALQFKTQHSQIWLNSSMMGLRHLMRISTVVLGGTAVLSGRLSVGTLVLFLSYIDSLLKPINQMLNFTSTLNRTRISLDRIDRICQVFEGKMEIGGIGRLTPNPSFDFISFHDTSFGYEGAPPVLSRFNHSFIGGQFIALIGPSGAGKSSFVKMLNRLVDPTLGQIKIAGLDLKDYELENLRQIVTVVPQNSFFVYGTILKNLELSCEDPITQQEALDACAKVNAQKMIEELPEGLHSIVGEGGRKLSGGQERRINLARAFLRKKSLIYVFDEATSGLDPISSRIVLDSVKELAKKGSLVLWVTHRMEEILASDQVVFFRPGTSPLVADHRTLISSDPEYRNFVTESNESNKKESELES